ncbi:hypothetical protein Dimus_021156 [Dionaea muscipula]
MALPSSQIPPSTLGCPIFSNLLLITASSHLLSSSSIFLNLLLIALPFSFSFVSSSSSQSRLAQQTNSHSRGTRTTATRIVATRTAAQQQLEGGQSRGTPLFRRTVEFGNDTEFGNQEVAAKLESALECKELRNESEIRFDNVNETRDFDACKFISPLEGEESDLQKRLLWTWP